MTDQGTDRRRAALDALAALDVCLECGGAAEHGHHVVPRSRGGTVTVPLCSKCHGRAHHQTQVGLGQERKRLRCYRGEIDRTAAGIDYGYRPTADGGQEPDVGGEWDTLAHVVDLYNAGHGVRSLARLLDAEGVRNRKGNAWGKDNLIQMLRAVRNGTHVLTVAPERKELSERSQSAQDTAMELRRAGYSQTQIGEVLRGKFPGSKWSQGNVHRLLNLGGAKDPRPYMFPDAHIRARLAVLTLRREGRTVAEIPRLLTGLGVASATERPWTVKMAERAVHPRNATSNHRDDLIVGADAPGRAFAMSDGRPQMVLF